MTRLDPPSRPWSETRLRVALAVIAVGMALVVVGLIVVWP
jgi:hypothetical protein